VSLSFVVPWLMCPLEESQIEAIPSQPVLP
jgi:hypothetical protein